MHGLCRARMTSLSGGRCACAAGCPARRCVDSCSKRLSRWRGDLARHSGDRRLDERSEWCGGGEGALYARVLVRTLVRRGLGRAGHGDAVDAIHRANGEERLGVCRRIGHPAGGQERAQQHRGKRECEGRTENGSAHGGPANIWRAPALRVKARRCRKPNRGARDFIPAPLCGSPRRRRAPAHAAFPCCVRCAANSSFRHPSRQPSRRARMCSTRPRRAADRPCGA